MMNRPGGDIYLFETNAFQHIRKSISQPLIVTATAYSPGACSIINAYATGLGSAFGIDLGISVSVCLMLNPWKTGKIHIGNMLPSSTGYKLVEECLNGVMVYCDLPNSFTAWISISSNLPVARGLKSSSALANATVLATAHALGIESSMKTVMSIARNAEVAAGCSKFGSVDDGYATLLGGVVIAEAASRELIMRSKAPEKLNVVVMTPPETERCLPVGVRKSMRFYRQEILLLHSAVLNGDIFAAMTSSGTLHAQQFGYDTSAIDSALENGAMAATLSGKGPALVALVDQDHTNNVVSAWRAYGHDIILTKVNNTGAMVSIERSSVFPRAIPFTEVGSLTREGNKWPVQC